MQKILSLTSKDFNTGITPYNNMPEMGVWNKDIQEGLNPYLTPGVIRMSGDLTDLTGSVVTDTPRASVTDGTKMYVLGTGKFYTVSNLNSTPSIALSRSVASLSTGIGILQPTAGTKYLYYWQNSQIGRFDLASTFVDAQFGAADGVVATDTHPVHKFFDTLYYGNKDRIGKIYDNAGTAATSGNVLDFSTDSIVTDLSDDGTYLIAAVSRATAATELFADSKIYFWDTNAPSWQREWTINDPYICSLQEKNGAIYALGSRGTYVFNFSTPPALIRTDITGTYNYPQQSSTYRDAVLLGNYTYGKLAPGFPNAAFKPFRVTNVSMVDAAASATNIFFGTTDNKLYYYANGAGASGSTGLTVSTAYLPLNQQYQIKEVWVDMDIQLASGDDANVTLYSAETGSSYRDYTNLSYAKHGAKQRVKLVPEAGVGGLITNTVKIQFGNIVNSLRIKKIELYGEPVE